MCLSVDESRKTKITIARLKKGRKEYEVPRDGRSNKEALKGVFGSFDLDFS